MELSHCILFTAEKGMYPVPPEAESKLLRCKFKKKNKIIYFVIQSVNSPFFFCSFLIVEIVTNQILEGKKSLHNYPLLLFFQIWPYADGALSTFKHM